MYFLNNPPIILLHSSPNDCDFSLDPDLSLSSSSPLHSNNYNYDLELYLQAYIHVMTSYILSTIPLNTPKTIQTPSSLVDSSLVSYAVFFILYGFKSCLFFTCWLYMIIVIIGIILHMFGYVLNTYGSDLKSINHSNFYTYQFSQLFIVFLV